MLIVVINFLARVSSRDLFTCSESTCPEYWVGDGICDQNCMNPSCNYDSPVYSTITREVLSASDCFGKCDCPSDLLGNGKCDSECDSYYCGWDMGDCGYCVSNCFEEMLTNDICDSECSTSDCMFDNDGCGWCNKGCSLSDLYSDICKIECKTDECYRHSTNPCLSSGCSPGCTEGMLGNGQCESFCNNAECDYDKHDCDCAEGCGFYQMQESTCKRDSAKIINDPCAVLSCSFKNYKCGDCAKDCFYENLGDGTCDIACNVESCNFDYGDCGCAMGCSYKYSSTDGTFSGKDSDKCSSYCLVLSCHFGASFCNEKELVMQAVLNYLVYNDKTKLLDTSKCECNSTSDYLANKNTCNNPLTDYNCTYKECFYCMGSTNYVNSACVKGSFEGCLICSTNMILNWCELKLSSCPGGYTDVSQLVSYFNIIRWCLPKPTSYSPSNFEIAYVNSSVKEVGDGSKSAPYKSLYRALVNVFASFTKILIQSKKNTLAVDDAESVLIIDKNNPLFTKSPEVFYELWIIGMNKEVAMVDVYYESTVLITPSAKKVYIQNIRFIGTKSIRVDCEYDVCAYCPLYIQYSESKYNDRGEKIEDEDFSKFSSNCSNYFNYNYFVFTTDVTISNVEFYNFRSQYNSFIKSSGILTLNQVNFKKMQAKSTGSVILITCTQNCINTFFTYNSGLIEGLGAGYEDSENVLTGSFLKASEIGSIQLKNLNFSLNFMLNNLRASIPGYLIYIFNHLGTIEISDCSFSKNYVNYLIFIDVSTLEYSNIQIKDGISQAYAQQHLLLQNLHIENTYCSNGLFFYSMQKVLHNIQISDLVISGSVVGDSGFFSIKNSGTVSKIDKEGAYQTKLINGEKIQAFIPSRKFSFMNVLISDSVTGGHGVYLENFSNSFIESVKITSVYDGDISSIQRIIDMFSSLGWFSRIDQENQIPDLKCNDFFSISNIFKINIRNVTVIYSSCSGDFASPGMVLKSINILYMQDVFMSDLLSSSLSGVALDIQTSTEVTINNLTLKNINNYQYSILQFDSCKTVSITSLYAFWLTSNYSCPFVVSKVIEFTLSKFQLIDLKTEFSNGGCLFVLTSAFGSSVDMLDGLFENCLTSNGKGGGIFLDGMSTRSACVFNAIGLQFKGCEANEGAVIYISSMNTFKEKYENMISYVNVKNCVSRQGGIIADYHNAGLLHIKDILLINNTGNNAGYMAYYSSNLASLKIEYATFIASISLDPVLSFRSLASLTKVELKSVTIYRTSSEVASIFTSKIDLTTVFLTLENIGAGVELTSESNMIADNFILNNCTLTGVSVTYSSSFNCENSQYLRNHHIILFVDKDSQVKIDSSLFKYNQVQLQVLFSLTSSKSGKNSISNSEIIENTVYANSLFLVSQANLEFFNVTISSNNIRKFDYSGIYLYKSTLYVNQSTFTNMTTLKQGSFIYAVTSSSIKLESSTFQYGLSYEGNVYVKDSDLTIISCNFLNNFGGDLYLETSNLTMTGTLIKNPVFGARDNWGSFVLVEGIEVNIKSCLFLSPVEDSRKLMQSLLYIDTYELVFIDGCTFQGSTAFSMGVYLENVEKVEIKESVFIQLSSSPYSSLTAVSTGNGRNLSIENSMFQNNTSTENGGALYVDNYNLTLVSCEISDNFAEYSGGGIFYKTSECSTCGLYLLGSTEIIENSCKMGGGAIKWMDFKPIFDSSEVIIQNNSAPYGGNLATEPSYVSFTSLRALSSSILSLSDVAPGQEFTDEIILYVKDTYNQIVTTDDSTTITLSTNTTEGVFSVSGTTSFTSQSGKITISNFTISGPPGSSVVLKLESTIEEKGSQNEDFSNKNTAFVNVSFRECQAGEQIETASCSLCPDGKYLLKAASNCKSCPNGASCIDGNVLIVDDGFWRSGLKSDVVYACEHFSACLKGNKENPLGSCSKGYAGVKCQSCELGYSMNPDYQCAKCPEKSANIAILFALSIGLVTISVILVKTTLKSAFTPKAMYSIYIKIFTNYLQLVLITTQFNLQWPSYVKQLFKVQQGAASVSDQIFSVDCYLDDKNVNDRSLGYFFKICFMAGMPFCIFFISYVFWIFHCFTFDSYQPLKREVFTTIIVLFFLVYPNIVKFLFGHFNCIDIDQMGSYLKTNSDIKCWSDKHNKFSYIVVIPGILLWIVGFPVLLLSIMKKNKKSLHLDNYRVIFGYLFNGYKLSRFYWEFIIMYRKILIISISVFLSSQAFIIQALTVIVVLVPSLYMQYEGSPYNSKELNHMETEALFTATITIYCGLYYLSDSISEEIKVALFLVIVLGNAYFLFYWIFFILKAVFDIFLKYFPQFKGRLKKGDAFDENFTEEVMAHEGVFHDKLEGRKSYTFLHQSERKVKEKLKFLKMDEAFYGVTKDEVKNFKAGRSPD